MKKSTKLQIASIALFTVGVLVIHLSYGIGMEMVLASIIFAIAQFLGTKADVSDIEEEYELAHKTMMDTVKAVEKKNSLLFEDRLKRLTEMAIQFGKDDPKMAQIYEYAMSQVRQLRDGTAKFFQ